MAGERRAVDADAKTTQIIQLIEVGRQPWRYLEAAGTERA
jgi:hypothetical protein